MKKWLIFVGPGVSNSDKQNSRPGGRGPVGVASKPIFETDRIRLLYLEYLIKDGADFDTAVDTEKFVSIQKELDVLKEEGLI